jgi:hypothetical protein
LHGRQDGMGDVVHVREEILRFQVYLIWTKPIVHYTHGQDTQIYQPHWSWWTTHGCSNKFLDELLSFLHKFIIPIDNCLPPTMYRTKSFIRKLGIECNVIHACKMGCILYRGVYVDLQECPKMQFF